MPVRYLVTLLSCCFVAFCNAQDLSISASVSKKSVTLNEQVQLTISISGSTGKLPGLNLPPLNDFDVYSSASSQNVSIVNGKVSSSYDYTFILVPKRQGKLLIPAFEIDFKGEKYTTNSIEIEVGAPGSSANGVTLPAPQAAPQAESFWIKQELNKRVCFVGEPVYYTFFFFADRGLASNPNLQLPDFSGFLKEDLPPPKRYTTSVNGKNYSVTEIKEAIFPVKAGNYNFAPAHLEIIESNFPFFNDDFFSGFFGGSRRKMLQSDSLSLSIKPLPDVGKPSNYKGDVGSYSISASVDKTRLKAGDALKLMVKISGTGNISSITQPDFPEFVNFKQYEVIASQKMQKENYLITGSKEFQTVLVPRLAGELVIPPIEYSYFDSSAGKYRQIKTREIKISVLPGDVINNAPEYATTLKEVSRDIRHIREISQFRLKGDGFIARNFKELLVIPFGALLIFLGVTSGIYEKIFPKAVMVRRAALAKAVASLKKAPGNPREMGEEFERIILCFIKERLGIERVASVKKALSEKKVSFDTVSSVTEFIRECQALRFSPVITGFQKKVYEKKLVELLKGLKKCI